MAPSVPVCHAELTGNLGHFDLPLASDVCMYPTQALANGLLNLCNSVSARLYSIFPDSRIKYFILEHHERLPQQLTSLTVTLHFRELHRVVSSSRDFHKVVFLVWNLKE